MDLHENEYQGTWSVDQSNTTDTLNEDPHYRAHSQSSRATTP